MYFFLALCSKKYHITIFAKQSVANFRVCASNFPLLFLIAFDSGVLFCCLTLIVLYGHFILKHSIFSSSFVVNLFVLESQSNTLLTIGSLFFSEILFISFFRWFHWSSLLLWLVFSFLCLTFLEFCYNFRNISLCFIVFLTSLFIVHNIASCICLAFSLTFCFFVSRLLGSIDFYSVVLLREILSILVSSSRRNSSEYFVCSFL